MVVLFMIHSGSSLRGSHWVIVCLKKGSHESFYRFEGKSKSFSTDFLRFHKSPEFQKQIRAAQHPRHPRSHQYF